MLKLTEIKRRTTTDAKLSPILLNRHAIAKVEEATDEKYGPCVKILSDEVPSMLCTGSVDDVHKKIREIEAKEAGDPVGELCEIVKQLTARVEELETNMSHFVVR